MAASAVSDLANQTSVSLPEPAYGVAINRPFHSAQRTGSYRSVPPFFPNPMVSDRFHLEND